MMKNSPDCNYVVKVDVNEFDEYKIILGQFANLIPQDSVAITTDYEGENIVALIDRDNYSNINDLQLDKKFIYIHFPYRKSRIVAGGINTDPIIGKGTHGNTINASPLHLKNIDFVQIASEEKRTIGLTEDGKLYLTGEKFFEEATNDTFLEYPTPSIPSKIVRIETSKQNIIAMTEDGKLYYQGPNEHHHLDPIPNYSNFVYLPRPNEDTENIVDLAIDNAHHFYITDNQKLYGLGAEIMEKLGVTGDLTQYQEIQLEPGMIPLKVKCCKSGAEYPPVFLLVDNNGHNELHVVGHGGGFLLGLGPDVSVSQGHKFNKLLYNEDLVEFTDIDAKGSTIYALTSRGKVYGWGEAGEYRLGEGNIGQLSTMAEINQLSPYYVHQIKASTMGLFCVVSPNRARNYKQLLFLGETKSFMHQTKITESLHSIDWIQPEKVDFIESTNQAFFLKIKEDSEYTQKTVHTGYQCSVTGQQPIEGTMHFFKDRGGEFKFLSEEGYQKEKLNLPKVCYATKYYIKDIESKNLRNINFPDSEFEETKDFEVEYISKMGYGNTPCDPVKTTEEEIFKRDMNDITPLIYYRIAQPLKNPEKLRYIQGYNFFDETDREGFSFKF